MCIANREEIRKLTFRALALRRISPHRRSTTVFLETYPLSSLVVNLFTVCETKRALFRGGGALGISAWGCAAGTLEPLTNTRASSAEFCYPILELTPQITPILD